MQFIPPSHTGFKTVHFWWCSRNRHRQQIKLVSPPSGNYMIKRIFLHPWPFRSNHVSMIYVHTAYELQVFHYVVETHFAC